MLRRLPTSPDREWADIGRVCHPEELALGSVVATDTLRSGDVRDREP
jgi:hypothetical protein